MIQNSNRYHSKILCLLAALACGIVQPSLAELQMGFQAQRDNISVGDTSKFIVQVAGVKPAEAPTIDVEKGDAAGIKWQLASTSTQLFNNGRETQRVASYTFAVTGVKPGTYSLSGALEHEGKMFGTEPKTLTVRPQTAEEKQLDPQLSIELDTPEIYLGELLPIKLFITTNPRTSPEFHNVSPELESEGFVMQPLRGIFRGGTDKQGNDRHYFTGICEPLRAGDLTLGPATYPIQLRIRDRNFGRSSRKQYNLTSPSIRVRVKPLPKEGKPASFAGSVGKYSLKVNASPTRVKQGEPISVSIAVSGEGNLPSIELPQLSGDLTKWKLYDPTRNDSRDDRRNRRDPLAPQANSGTVTFNQMIVPLEAHSEIPPFEFSFFDPELGQYRTLRSEPIEIDVTPAPNQPAVAATTPAEIDTTPPPPEPTPLKAPPVEDMADILTIRDFGDQPWRGARKPLSQSTMFWALQAPPAAALLAFIGIAVARHRSGRVRSTGWAGTYPPCAEILRKLEARSQTAPDFYANAHQFVEAWREQTRAIPPLSEEQDRALENIATQHGFLSFGSPPESETSRPIEKDERREIISALKSLPSHD